MKLARFAMHVCLALAPSFGAERCSRIWNAAELVRSAQELDQQIVCARVLLQHAPTHSKENLAVYEAVPLNANDRRPDTIRIGLIDWDKRLGIPESLYHPESFELLDKASGQCPGSNESDINYDAVLKARVEYKKGLTERAFRSLPPNLSEAKPSVGHYDVELVLLEFQKIKAVCNK